MLNRKPVAVQSLVGGVGRIVEIGLVRASRSRGRGADMSRRRLHGQHTDCKERNACANDRNRARPTQQSPSPESHLCSPPVPFPPRMKLMGRMRRNHMLGVPGNSTAISARRRVKTDMDNTAPSESTWSDHEVSRQIATEAGRLLVDLRRSIPESTDERWLRDQGDARSHRMIMDRLATLRPDDAILSEEGKDDQQRLRHRRVWVIDPLDGTREFGEPPRDDWAVHVALCVDGEPVAGSVALPAQGRVLTTADPFGNAPADSEPLRMVASRTRAPEIVTDVAP